MSACLSINTGGIYLGHGEPTLDGEGFLPGWGYLPQTGRTTLDGEVPTLDGGTYLGLGYLPLTGVPTLDRGYQLGHGRGNNRFI